MTLLVLQPVQHSDSQRKLSIEYMFKKKRRRRKGERGRERGGKEKGGKYKYNNYIIILIL